MAENSKIEWTHHTMNFWIGCSKVHAGCANCYAETLMDTRYGRVKWGPNGTRAKTAEQNWSQPLKWNKAARKAGERHRVFCQSLSDIFEVWDGPILDHLGRQLFRIPGGCTIEEFPPTLVRDQAKRRPPATMDILRMDASAVIACCGNLDWLLLTKRPENAPSMMREMGIYGADNVWLGASASNQETFDTMSEHLLAAKGVAPVRFMSLEPLVGPIDLHLGSVTCEACGFRHARFDTPRCVRCRHRFYETARPRSLDWVIVGGESGQGRRPFDCDWARAIRDQCASAGVPFFMKQVDKVQEIPEDLMIRQFPNETGVLL